MSIVDSSESETSERPESDAAGDGEEEGAELRGELSSCCCEVTATQAMVKAARATVGE